MNSAPGRHTPLWTNQFCLQLHLTSIVLSYKCAYSSNCPLEGLRHHTSFFIQELNKIFNTFASLVL